MQDMFPQEYDALADRISEENYEFYASLDPFDEKVAYWYERGIEMGYIAYSTPYEEAAEKNTVDFLIFDDVSFESDVGFDASMLEDLPSITNLSDIMVDEDGDERLPPFDLLLE